jgi:hypothetical protein
MTRPLCAYELSDSRPLFARLVVALRLPELLSVPDVSGDRSIERISLILTRIPEQILGLVVKGLRKGADPGGRQPLRPSRAAAECS